MSYTPQGLVTVAFLKTQLDAGRDHLSLFEPLVLDALNQIQNTDLAAGEVREVVYERTNLRVPVPTVQTILGRCAKNGYLMRSGGRFHKTQIPVPPSDLGVASEKIRSGQTLLGEALVEHSRGAGIAFSSPDEAVQALAGFISAHKLELLLQHSPADPRPGELKTARNFARFITERCIPEPSLNGPLTSLLEGILLADVLLMRDVQSSQLKFSGSCVFLDTRILLAALGLNGAADELATKEGLAAIRNAGAQTSAFEGTVTEIRGILHVYEEKLGTNDGRLSLFPTSMTSHMIANRYTPADVRVIALELEQRLRFIAINIRPFPPHVSEHTLDEASLTRILSKTNGSQNGLEPRAKHDADCAAAILTLRAGQVAYDVERCSATFSTTSGLVVKNVQQWYSEQHGEGVPPVVHHALLTTLAWLKKPAFSPDLKLHELAAVCLSAMRPTEAAWTKMLSALRQYVAEGRMSDDESVAIVANGLTETLLSRFDDDFEPDAANITEAIERVREELRREHVTAAQVEVARVRSEAETQLREAHKSESLAKAEALEAQGAATEARASAIQAATDVDRLARGIARLVGMAVHIVIIALLLAGLASAVISVPHARHPVIHWIAAGTFGAATLLGFLGSAWGISAKSVGDRVENWVMERLKRKNPDR
jgi:hypothetical protein